MLQILEKDYNNAFTSALNGFLDGFFPEVLILTSGVQLGPDRRLQVFPEVSDHDFLVWSGSKIKLSENYLQVLQVEHLVKDFL